MISSSVRLGTGVSTLVRVRLGQADTNNLDSRAFVSFRLQRYEDAVVDCTAAIAADPQSCRWALYVRSRQVGERR